MAELDRPALKTENDTLFPDNTNQEITPARERQFNSDMVDSNLNISDTASQTIDGPLVLSGVLQVDAASNFNDTITVVGNVNIDGDLTANSGTFLPATVSVGSIDMAQAGTLLQIDSAIDDLSYLLLGIPYTIADGSLPIEVPVLDPEAQIDLIPSTGTKFTLFTGQQPPGSASPGVNAYQTSLAIFTYDEIFNLTLVGRINSHTGTVVAGVKDYNSGAIPSAVITGITQATTAVVTAAAHGRANGERVAVTEVTGMTEINETVAVIANVTANTFEMVGVDSSLFGAYAGDGIASGKLVTIVFDNLNRVNNAQTYYTTITVDQPFDVDGDAFFSPYQEINGYNISDTKTVVLSGDTPEFSGIDFIPQASQQAYKEGRAYYNDVTKTLDFYNDISDVTINLPEEVPIRVFNDSGSTITNGQAVRVDGASGGLPTIVLSQADTVDNAICTGISTHDIEDQTTGYITAIGSVGSVDTSTFSAGDIIFVDETTPGAITNIEQKILSPVGIVLTSDMTTGEIFSKPRGLINVTAVGQVALSTSPPVIQAVSSTPAPVAGYINSEVPAVNVTPTFTAQGSHFEASMSPSTVGASGFYSISFSASGSLSLNQVLVFTIYINGSPSSISGRIDMTSNNLDEGSVSFTATTPVVIDNTTDVEIYVNTLAGSPNFTYESLTFSMTRVGNA